jgi:hypothetical protein
MSNKQQTAVEWLEETMLKPLIQWPDDIWEQAKEMEKEQIINAVDGFPLRNRNLNGTEYYNETYGGNNEN